MKPQTWKKKGAILVYVVLIMALLIVFGVGMIFLANHNSNTTVNEVYAEQAYLTARSGLRSTMTMMEEDTAKTSDVASQLKTAKTLTSSVDLTANKLGTVSVQVSCTDTDCTILQIDSTGTYQGVSQTVTGYMKSSAPAINSPFVVFNDVSGNTNANTKVIGFNGDSLPITSQNMGFSQKSIRLIRDLSKYSNGIILATGPTGSGKTTTLYAMLKEIINPKLNIVTVEDPVEKRISGVNQVQVNTKAGLTFAGGLRSILRQDPDVIMCSAIASP